MASVRLADGETSLSSTTASRAVVRRLAGVRLLPTLSAIVIGLLIWSTLTQFVPSYMLPLPQKVGETWLRLLLNGSLWKHVSTTLSEALLGFGLAFVVGASLAYPLAR